LLLLKLFVCFFFFSFFFTFSFQAELDLFLSLDLMRLDFLFPKFSPGLSIRIYGFFLFFFRFFPLTKLLSGSGFPCGCTMVNPIYSPVSPRGARIFFPLFFLPLPLSGHPTLLTLPPEIPFFPLFYSRAVFTDLTLFPVPFPPVGACYSVPFIFDTDHISHVFLVTFHFFSTFEPSFHRCRFFFPLMIVRALSFCATSLFLLPFFSCPPSQFLAPCWFSWLKVIVPPDPCDPTSSFFSIIGPLFPSFFLCNPFLGSDVFSPFFFLLVPPPPSTPRKPF